MDGERTKSDSPAREFNNSRSFTGNGKLRRCLRRLLSLVVTNSFDIRSFAKGNFSLRMILMFDNFGLEKVANYITERLQQLLRLSVIYVLYK